MEADHGSLKTRLRPMRGLKTISSLRTIAAGRAFVQNLRRGHYEITVDVDILVRVRAAFDDLATPLIVRIAPVEAVTFASRSINATASSRLLCNGGRAVIEFRNS